MATVTAEGFLMPMHCVNELDVLLWLNCGVSTEGPCMDVTQIIPKSRGHLLSPFVSQCMHVCGVCMVDSWSCW